MEGRLVAAGDKELRKHFSIVAARAFNKILDDENDFFSSSDKKSNTAKYYVLMEKAFCLLNSEEKEHIDEAINIYQYIADKAPENPVVFFRHAQALASLGEFDEAISLYCVCIDLLEKDRCPGNTKCPQPPAAPHQVMLRCTLW